MKKILILITSLFIFFSCTTNTVSVPEDTSDSMAVLITEFKKETDLKQFGSYTFQIKNEDSKYKEYINFRTDRTFFLNNLEPGKYDVTYSFLYKNGKRGSYSQLFSFYVPEGKAIIVGKKIVIKIYEDKKNHATMTRYSESISVNDKRRIIDDLIEKYPELSAWEWMRD